MKSPSLAPWPLHPGPSLLLPGATLEFGTFRGILWTPVLGATPGPCPAVAEGAACGGRPDTEQCLVSQEALPHGPLDSQHLHTVCPVRAPSAHTQGRPCRFRENRLAEAEQEALRGSLWAGPDGHPCPFQAQGTQWTSPHSGLAPTPGELIPTPICSTVLVWTPQEYSVLFCSLHFTGRRKEFFKCYGSVNEQRSFSLKHFPTKSNTFLFSTRKIKYKEAGREPRPPAQSLQTAVLRWGLFS